MDSQGIASTELVCASLIALCCAVLCWMGWDGMGWDGHCLIVAEYLRPYPTVGLSRVRMYACSSGCTTGPQADVVPVVRVCGGYMFLLKETSVLRCVVVGPYPHVQGLLVFLRMTFSGTALRTF